MALYDSATVYDSSAIYDGVTAGTKPVFDVRLYEAIGGTSSTSIVAKVRRVTITRGRGPLSFGTFDPGRCEIELVDFDSSILPGNTGGLQPRVNTPVQVSVAWGGETLALFTGFLDTCITRWVKGATVAFTSMTFTDGMKLLSKATTTLDGTAGDRPAARVLTYLADVNLGASPGAEVLYDSAALYDSATLYGGEYQSRLIDTLTDVMLQADTTDRRSVLDAVRRVELAEAGALYFDAYGRCVFLGRSRAWPTTGVQYALTDDSTDTASATYTDITATTDEQLLFNRVSVTRDGGGVEQVAQNTTSQTTYFVRDLNMTGVICTTDTEAATLAAHHLAKRGLPLDRVDDIDVAAYASEPNLQLALGVELLDVVSVRRAAPAWTSTTTLVVSGIRHTITPDDWRLQLSTQQRTS